MTPGRLPRLAALALLALPLAGCGGFSVGSLLPSVGAPRAEAETEVPALWREDMVVTVEGRIQGPPSRPGRCRLLYPETGEPFAILGATAAYAEGARVRVSGPLALWSDCETYRTLRADRIAPAS